MTSLFDLNPLATDQKTVAERQWKEGLKPGKPQKACDIGLFSDDAAQLDLVETCHRALDPVVFQQPVED